MQWGEARKFLNGIFNRDQAALSRRDMLAGLGLAALFATAPKLLAPGVAEASPVVAPETDDVTTSEAAEPAAEQRNAANDGVTEFSSQPYWRYRRRWRRRYWRRRYWRRRYWYRPYGYRRRYWRRRYWRRRYWW